MQKEHVKRKLSILMILVAVPVILIFTWYFGDRKYYLSSLAVIICAIAAFWTGFERRKPQTRVIVLLAVICAVAVVSRGAFIMIPQFKPMAAVIMICGMYLGPRAGFTAGSISMFASNFIFGQGPWTPWQMFAFGLAGFLAGILKKKRVMTEERIFITSLTGGVMIPLIVGPILDTCTVFMMSTMMDADSILAVYAAGLPFNMIHGAATFLTLLLLCRPVGRKLERIKSKYGIGEV